MQDLLRNSYSWLSLSSAWRDLMFPPVWYEKELELTSEYYLPLQQTTKERARTTKKTMETRSVESHRFSSGLLYAHVVV
jgi:hypothetical protein